jgi:hypothetical protein
MYHNIKRRIDMSELTVGHLMEFIQGLDDYISIEVDHGGAYYYIYN